MKKILAILSGVAMLFASCENSGVGSTEEQKPNFPALQEITAESGVSYELTFTVDKEWSLALTEKSRPYASMTYNGFEDFQCSGEAGEHTVTIKMQEGLSSYIEDFVAEVEMTIEGYTQTVAIYTIPNIPYTVTGSAPVGMEADVLSYLEEGGHPENGPFVNAPNTFTVYYLSGADAMYGEFVVSHAVDFKYEYEVYAKSSTTGEFEKLESDSNEWIAFTTFGDKSEKFRLAMDYRNAKAVRTEGVGYEAYVNMVNEDGVTMISVYYLYDPTRVVEVKPTIALANPELAKEKGVTFVGEGTAYSMTFASPNLLVEECAAATLKLEGFSDFYGGIQSGTSELKFEKDIATGLCYLTLSEGANAETLRREDVLTISGTVKGGGGLREYTINLVFEWAKAIPDEETPVETPEE